MIDLEELLYEKEDREYSRFSNYDKSNFYRKVIQKQHQTKMNLQVLIKRKLH